MQVLQLYGRLMAWLENARPDVNVNSGYWAAAALQHAMMHYLVCPIAVLLVSGC